MHQPILDNSVLLQRKIAEALSQAGIDDDLKQAMPDPLARRELEQTCASSVELLAKACALYGSRPAIGYRRSEPYIDQASGLSSLRTKAEFTTLTYGDLWQRVSRLASGLAAGLGLSAGDRIGICGPATIDFLTVDFAALLLGAVSVPLQTTISSVDFAHILQESAVSCLVLSASALADITRWLPLPRHVRHLVITDLEAEDELRRAQFAHQQKNIQLEAPWLQISTQFDLSKSGTHEALPSPKYSLGTDDPLVSIMYTSGSTGTPKGALFQERGWYDIWKSCLKGGFDSIPYIWVNFMPFNHIMGRLGVMRSIMQGGTTYLTHKSDMSTLIEDIQLVRPTVLTLVPRVAVMIFQHYQLTLAKWQRDGIADAAQSLSSSLKKSYLGDRLVFASTGSAPLSPQISDFIKSCFEIPLFDGYGSTEAGIITFDHRIRRENVIDYRLVDVPELGYLTSDKPYPRGELRVKTRQTVPGYLNNDEATFALFDECGYLKTGDIVEERAPDHIVWIDRSKNVLKLAQGEFVSTWHLESTYTGGSAAIEQIYLYGNSLRSYLVAVVVPSFAFMQSIGDDPIAMASAKQIIQADIRRIAASSGLRSFEIPRDFIIETTPFTKENGLVTESNKLVHPKLRAKYESRLSELYDQLEQGHITDGTASASNKPFDLVMNGLKATLGVSLANTDIRFMDLGGDSLDSVRFSNLIEQQSGVTIPVSLILSPTSTLGHIVDYLEQNRENASSGNTSGFARIHGPHPDTVYANDLDLDKIFSAQELSAASKLASHAPSETAKNVLLTGANGYLGRFLMLALLDRLPHNGSLYCLVRAENDASARQRLFQGFAENSADNELVYRAQVDKRLTVLAGDLVKDHFGLSDERFHALVHQVDTIVHNGALVNHAFSYQQLFEPNVLGTTEIMRLALTGRKKSINFISSVGVASGYPGKGMVLENEDVCTVWPSRSLTPGYAAGYATSKWASEVLLRRLFERCGVPVNTFRCGMILAHSSAAGQINAADFFSRLLAGLVYTGIAPGSFYNDPLTAKTAHFGGLPVDFVAATICGCAVQHDKRYATYHVVNPHLDRPVSLDLIVAWIRSYGYSVMTVNDHAHWYQQFKQRLSDLDHVKRSHSPLPIVYQWERPLETHADIRLDSRCFVEMVQGLARTGRIKQYIPNLTEDYIHKCLSDMVQLGLIDKPSRA